MTTDHSAAWRGGRRQFGVPRRALAAAALALTLVLGGCGSGGSEGSGKGAVKGGQAMPADQRDALRTPGAPASLSDLRGLDQLATLFDQHQDVPQLILLLSPT